MARLGQILGHDNGVVILIYWIFKNRFSQELTRCALESAQLW